MIVGTFIRRLGFFMLLPVAALGAEGELGNALSWLQKMARAAHQQNYEGDFVYDDGERLDALRIVHQGGERKRERIISLNGSGREVLREGDKVLCIFPESRQIYEDSDLPGYALQFSEADVERLQRFYDMAVVGRDRVADRAAVVVEVTPRDEFRYGYRLWLDEETALMLKSELVDPRGRVVERLMFTRLNYLDQVPEVLLQPEIRTDGFQRVINDGRPIAAERSSWQVSWLPGGFQLAEERHRPAKKGRPPLVQMVFGDGFSLVSVFIEPAPPEEAGEGVLLDKGAVHGYSVLRDGYRITAIGELPALAVARIARSVRPHELARAQTVRPLATAQ